MATRSLEERVQVYAGEPGKVPALGFGTFFQDSDLAQDGVLTMDPPVDLDAVKAADWIVSSKYEYLVKFRNMCPVGGHLGVMVFGISVSQRR